MGYTVIHAHNTQRSGPVFFWLCKPRTWKLRLKRWSLARGHPAERDSNRKRPAAGAQAERGPTHFLLLPASLRAGN